MDLQKIEEVIRLSTAEGPYKVQAIEQLHTLRNNPDAGNIGIQLFFNSQDLQARFFGLSLVKDYLKGIVGSLLMDPATFSNRDKIRESILSWLHSYFEHISSGSTQNNPYLNIPPYLLSNIVFIYTLLIKIDYPERWPSAFNDLLYFGHKYAVKDSIFFITKVLTELEAEVVVFNENRNKEEVAHNTEIKDVMRSTEVMPRIVNFLSQTILISLNTPSSDSELVAHACLMCLSELIGWIDLNLVINESLNVIYMSFKSSSMKIKYGALSCIYSLIKKGMDPVDKVEMIKAINLVPLLFENKFSFNNISPLKLSDYDELDPNDPADIHSVHKKMALVLDMLALELIGCWSKFEEILFPTNKSLTPYPSKSPPMTPTSLNPVSFSQIDQKLLSSIPIISSLIRGVINELIAYLSHPNIFVGSSVQQGSNRLVQMMKSQKPKEEVLKGMVSQNSLPKDYPFASEYLDQLLMSIHSQSQYPQDVNGSEEEENEVIQNKSEIRKIFVNLCRVYPERCIELISMALQSLPQPLKKAPFPPLEASLRLLHAHMESGVSLNQADRQLTFTNLLKAIQSSQIWLHPHFMVQVAYFELSVRYLNLLEFPHRIQLANALVSSINKLGTIPRTDYSENIRSKLCSLLLRLCESMEGLSFILLPSIGNIIKEILINSLNQKMEKLISCNPQVSKLNLLTSSAETNLCEVLSLLSISNPLGGIPSSLGDPLVLMGLDQPGFTISAFSEQQKSFLKNQLVSFTQQLSHFSVMASNSLSNPSSSPSIEVIESFLTQTINNLSVLIKHITKESISSFISELETLCKLVCDIMPLVITTSSSNSTINFSNTSSLISGNAPSNSNGLRGRVVIFFHHVIKIIGSQSLHVISQSLLMLLISSVSVVDMDVVIQLLIKILCESKEQSYSFIRLVFGWVIAKYQHLFKLYVDSPAEFSDLLKQMSLFLQNIGQYNLESILYTLNPSHFSSQLDLIIQNGIGVPNISINLTSFSNVTSILNSSSEVEVKSVSNSYLVLVCEWMLLFLQHLSPLNTPLPQNSFVALKKQATAVINHLVSGSLLKGDPIPPEAALYIPRPPEHLYLEARQYFRVFVFDRWIPALALVLGNPRNTPIISVNPFPSVCLYYTPAIKINSKDAMSQSILNEIAQLIWALHFTPPDAAHPIPPTPAIPNPVFKNPEFLSYLQSILVQTGWSNQQCVDILKDLQPQTPLLVPSGTFKESFKLFIRSNF